MNISAFFGKRNQPSLTVSIIPFSFLIASLLTVIIVSGADGVFSLGPWILLSASAIALSLATVGRIASRRYLGLGLRRSAIQILPAIPILICIAIVATTWMLSGVVPTLIAYGLHFLSPKLFLFIACMVCSVISVMTGSSWTTIATIGVAFIGIGRILGYSDPWIAGAIISGAYFGDKVSPLSDTTVVASSTAGVDLFDHIRYLMFTTVPAMTIALLVYIAVGFLTPLHSSPESAPLLNALHSTFSISPYTLLIPLVTLIMIALRIHTFIVLLTAGFLGAVGVFVFQPQIGMSVAELASSVWSGADMATGNNALDELVATGGVLGMLPTVFLVLSAMVFGSVMIGTGMLTKLTDSFTRRLRKRTSIVGATVASGITMNCATGDQYLSLIITGNMYRSLYRRNGLEPRLLSRSMEDSISVTSVLVPWNSCGLTQSMVLGVSTLAYFPCCIFNLLTPLMSIIMARVGFKIRQSIPAAASA
ncbi:MAG: sodium:proton antiporter [Bacteroides sp.]|nr:sodium:proton antiporter [Bacteroides sp.]MCM1389851.1 sodium:proton antiporter [Bacteroides sp.]